MKTFTQFIQHIFDSRNDIKHDEKNCKFYCDNGSLTYYTECVTYPKCHDDCYEIEVLNANEKRTGTGAALLNAMIDFAKKTHKNIVVYAMPLDDSISENDLIAFYKKYGFTQDTDDKHCLIYNS